MGALLHHGILWHLFFYGAHAQCSSGFDSRECCERLEIMLLGILVGGQLRHGIVVHRPGDFVVAEAEIEVDVCILQRMRIVVIGGGSEHVAADLNALPVLFLQTQRADNTLCILPVSGRWERRIRHAVLLLAAAAAAAAAANVHAPGQNSNAGRESVVYLRCCGDQRWFATRNASRRPG